MATDSSQRTHTLAASCALFIMVASLPAQAGCETDVSHPLNIELKSRQVMITPSMTVGSEILRVSSGRPFTPTYSCRNLKSIQPEAPQRRYELTHQPYGLDPYEPRTYKTGLDGIGVQLYAHETSVDEKYRFPVAESAEPMRIGERRTYTLSTHGASYRFIRTSDKVSYGRINANDLPEGIARAFMPSEEGTAAKLLDISVFGYIDIVAPTCTLMSSSKAQTVTLPTVRTQQIESSLTTQATFRLELRNCTNTHDVRFTFAGDPAGKAGTPEGAWLKNVGTAKGVAIALHATNGSNMQEIRFDKHGGAHTFTRKPGSDKGLVLMLTADYRDMDKTRPNSISPGSVNATATVQVDYL